MSNIVREPEANLVRASQLAIPELVEPLEWSETTLNQFQQIAVQTAIYPETSSLAGVVFYKMRGELEELKEKLEVDVSFSDLSDDQRYGIALEVGDAWWYLSETCRALDLQLGDVALYQADQYGMGYGHRLRDAILSRHPEYNSPDWVEISPDLTIDEYQRIIVDEFSLDGPVTVRGLFGNLLHLLDDNYLGEEAEEFLKNLSDTIDLNSIANPTPQHHASVIQGIIATSFDIYEGNSRVLRQGVERTLIEVTIVSARLGYTLSEISRMTMDKLRSRLERKVIIGEGDYR